MTPFNLLQYPALASQRRRHHRRWTSLTGWVVGSLAGLGLVAVLKAQHVQLQRERDELQSRWDQVQASLSADKARQVLHQNWQQQTVRVQQLSAQQRTWAALHQTLLEVAGPESVQLLRMQLDAQTLELHGQALDMQRMVQAQMRLPKLDAGANFDKAWTLVNLVNTPEASRTPLQPPLEFVWQTAWTQLGVASATDAVQRSLLKAEQHRGPRP